MMSIMAIPMAMVFSIDSLLTQLRRITSTCLRLHTVPCMCSPFHSVPMADFVGTYSISLGLCLSTMRRAAGSSSREAAPPSERSCTHYFFRSLSSRLRSLLRSSAGPSTVSSTMSTASSLRKPRSLFPYNRWKQGQGRRDSHFRRILLSR